MSKRTVSSFQMTEADARKFDALEQAGFGTRTDIIRTALDRMYIQEIKTMNVTRESLTETFNLMFNNVPLTSEEEAAAAEWDKEQNAKAEEVQAALSRFIAGTNSMADTLLLEKSALVEAIYRSDEDNDDERPIGFRLRKIDGNEYTDQVGLEDKPSRL